MKFSRLKTSKGVKYPVICSFIAILAGFSFPQLTQAQQSASQSSISMDPLKTIQWASGPQTINLGMADINLPKGYRLTDAHGARVILDSVNNPVPDGVLAVLAPDSGKWWALLQYSDSGYVKDADITQINPKKVLKEAQARINANQGTTSKATLTWQSQPVYDPATHSWTWALDAQMPSAKVMNQMAVLLGRHGVLQITAIQNYPLSATASLQQLAANITFKDGERYTDYQSGDRIAQIGLADLIAGGKQTSTSFLSAMTVWVYFGLGAALIAGGVVVLVRRKNHHHAAPAKAPVTVAAKAPALVAASAMASIPSSNGLNGNGNGHSQFNGNGHAQPKTAPDGKRESRQFHRNRRKRMFDYPKFYTNVMNELSLRSYNGPTIATNGKSKTNGHTNGANGNGYANGHANGHANGNTNGYANGHTNGTNGSGATEGLKSEIVELIATQKNLIQEQKCLLEQQTRLIEEKRWLIQEQTAFLKNQALVNDQQYPLKFE